MNINKWHLQDNFSIIEVENFPEEFYSLKLTDQLTSEYPFLKWQQELEEETKKKIKELASLTKDSYKLKLVLLKDDELIGFSYGWQESSTVFFMAASLVLPKYRKQGLYSEMVNKILGITRMKGFQSVSSFHVATNNPVIISKLKLGFTISGMQLDAVHGILVKLIYHHNEMLLSALKFRAGAVGESGVREMLVQSI